MTDKPETIFKPGENYLIRGDGTPQSKQQARVYATDGEGSRPIHGAIKGPDGEWYLIKWSMEGLILPGEKCPNDLMPPKPKPREVWIWMYDNGDIGGNVYRTEKQANKCHILKNAHAVKFKEVMDDD